MHCAICTSERTASPEDLGVSLLFAISIFEYLIAAIYQENLPIQFRDTYLVRHRRLFCVYVDSTYYVEEGGVHSEQASHIGSS